MSADAIAVSHLDPAPLVRQWIVINTHPHREDYARQHLERQGYDVYCPMLLRRVKHARRIQDLPRPMFPSYIFVNIDTTTRQWRPILSTHGVRSVIRSGDYPRLLDDRFVVELKAREVDGLIRRPASPFRVDQEVLVQAGPLHGLVGRIVELQDKDRVVVLLQMLSQAVKLRAHAHQLSPV